MRKVWLISSLTICAMAVTLSAKEFPLRFKALTLDEAMDLPGPYGAYGALVPRKLSALRKEPKAASGRPLYGKVGRNPNRKGFLFRVDESRGSGTGYDQLLLDLNQNGDLTDDQAIKLADKPVTRKSGRMTREVSHFGPIEAPAANSIGDWRPVYFAEITYYRRFATPSGVRVSYLGQLRLKAGYYLETEIGLNGTKRKIALVDGNANLQLGDESTPRTYTRDGEKNWYFAPGDAFLQDTDGSGKFDNRPGNPEFSPFGKILYLGATPYRVTPAANYSSLRIEPWNEGLADLSVQPKGDSVRELLLAWERKADDWVLIKADTVHGHAKVPSGKLRLTGCVLEGTAHDGQPLVLGSYYRKMDKTLSAHAGQTTALNCGAPFKVRLTARKANRSERLNLETDLGNRATSSTVVLIEAEVLGVAGETVSTFAKGRNLKDEPRKPRFTVRDKNGNEVASGNLEYG